MVRRGTAPFLECSSRGDKRFSAFFARPSSLGGRTIEEVYQGMKKLPDGTTGLSIKKAKGKRATNADECVKAYERMWREWVEEEELLSVLKAASGLSDIFGREGGVCQADVLWRIRNGK